MREGRPREMGSQERGKPVSVYLDPQQLEALNKIRGYHSLSSVVRTAIDEYILKNK
jgi:hypothetical protein